MPRNHNPDKIRRLIEIGESREEFYKGKITGASASTGAGPRSRFKKVSDGVTRSASLPQEHSDASEFG